ncbi:MAG: class II aldolase/adducin family protein [Chloroflexota bacterium]|nr:class II aldolase/adducin family protein [Chloroflexota bacterium]
MKFAVVKHGSYLLRDEVAEGIISAFRAHGHQLCDESEESVRAAFNLTDINKPEVYRRRGRAIPVISIVAADRLPENARRATYIATVHSLSNVLLLVVPGDEVPEVYFTTLEAGFYHIPYDPEEVYQRLIPLITATPAIENEITPDLPKTYGKGTPITEAMVRCGKELSRLGVLPAPFPIHELISKRDLHLLYKLYGMTGLSYGNFSARESIAELGPATFWMTARGVNKAKLSKIGYDLVLVKGYDPGRKTVLVSVPPDYRPTIKASVDAIEHYLIYSNFPDVGAIIHVHAWMEGIPCTSQNYPCGTQELAEQVVDLLQQAEDPSRAVIGLKNHGITITGHSLDEIFDRIRGKLLPQVPMMA